MDKQWSYIFEEYGRLLKSVDTWFSGCLDRFVSRMACRGGCSECCRGLFDITLLDAWYLRAGFDRLPDQVRRQVMEKAQERVSSLQVIWPEFAPPYLLNHRPESEWEELMPDEDETPCVLLDEAGRCLVYEYRPMTCRLHGLPLVDISGEVMHDEWCTKNFVAEDPLALPELRADFTAIFRDEVLQFRRFTWKILKKEFNELDTFIPAALLIDFSGFDWIRWAGRFQVVPNDPV